MSEMYILYSFKYSLFEVFLSFLNEITMIFHTYKMFYIFYTKKFSIIIQSVKMILVHPKCKIIFCIRNSLLLLPIIALPHFVKAIVVAVKLFAYYFIHCLIPDIFSVLLALLSLFQLLRQ